MIQADLAREFSVTPITASRWVKLGCPLTSPEHAADWLEANDNARHTRAWRMKRESAGLTIREGRADATDPTVKGMLSRIQQAEIDAYAETQIAAPGSQRAAVLDMYGRTVKLRQNAEREVVDLLKEMGELITPQASRDIITETLGPIAELLDSIDDDLAEAINPADPDLARRILSEWKEKAKSEVRAALTGNGGE